MKTLIIIWCVGSIGIFGADTITQGVMGETPWGKLTFKKALYRCLLWPILSLLAIPKYIKKIYTIEEEIE